MEGGGDVLGGPGLDSQGIPAAGTPCGLQQIRRSPPILAGLSSAPGRVLPRNYRLPASLSLLCIWMLLHSGPPDTALPTTLMTSTDTQAITPSFRGSPSRAPGTLGVKQSLGRGLHESGPATPPTLPLSYACPLDPRVHHDGPTTGPWPTLCLRPGIRFPASFALWSCSSFMSSPGAVSARSCPRPS